MYVKLIITGNGENYSYDSNTDTMIGNGEYLEMMNNMIEIADYGVNPYKQIAELMQAIEYKVQYNFTPDKGKLDGI
jgi:hypothetical protein